MRTILIVDDEPKLLRLLEMQLSQEGYATLTAANASEGLRRLREQPADLLLTDLRLPGMDGLEFLHAAKHLQAGLPVIVMTAHGSVETAVEAMKAGAADYLLKPFPLEELRLVIQKELDVQGLRYENASLREALGQRYDYPNIIGRGPRMQEVLALVERVAPTQSTVLIGGESGVGKDLIARAIHQHSRRSAGPFIKINSTAIPENLLESELFGYERGAFTGAVGSKPGKFELADHGTLFLDEIGDVPLAIQVKLLRVLQEREFERLGGTKTLKVDVRLIAATNRNLRAALEEGTFREDLYYRLNVVPIDIPPLRQHKEDIPALAEHFAARFAREAGKPLAGITPAAMAKLIEFDWPGNVREMENIIERAVALGDGSRLDVGDIRLDQSPSRAPAGTAALLPEGWTLEKWEQEVIRDALRRAQGNKSQAARLLGLSRNALRYRLSTMGVEDSEPGG
ncbi:MAG TPA: sigma-54 dependent transcriptional regulator [Terriglobales bacterium]|nr:sigma-54 dependent transcriptional regulator [Terriglobales bacterium]